MWINFNNIIHIDINKVKKKYPRTFQEDLNNPVLASIIATLSMTLMLLSNYIYPYIGNISIILWFIAIIIHIMFVLNYIMKYLYKIDISDFTAGSFVVFAGIQMIAITAPIFNQKIIGTISFWISFLFVLIVFTIVTYRYLKIPVVKQIKPIIGVMQHHLVYVLLVILLQFLQ